MIRRAKFPRKPAVVAYQQVTPGFRRFMSGGGGNMSDLNALAERLRTKARREEGYNRDEALRCVAAIEAFKETYAKTRWGKIEFGTGPQDVGFKIACVPITGIRQGAADDLGPAGE